MDYAALPLRTRTDTIVLRAALQWYAAVERNHARENTQLATRADDLARRLDEVDPWKS